MRGLARLPHSRGNRISYLSPPLPRRLATILIRSFSRCMLWRYSALSTSSTIIITSVLTNADDTLRTCPWALVPGSGVGRWHRVVACRSKRAACAIPVWLCDGRRVATSSQRNSACCRLPRATNASLCLPPLTRGDSSSARRVALPLLSRERADERGARSLRATCTCRRPSSVSPLAGLPTRILSPTASPLATHRLLLLLPPLSYAAVCLHLRPGSAASRLSAFSLLWRWQLPHSFHSAAVMAWRCNDIATLRHDDAYDGVGLLLPLKRMALGRRKPFFAMPPARHAIGSLPFAAAGQHARACHRLTYARASTRATRQTCAAARHAALATARLPPRRA